MTTTMKYANLDLGTVEAVFNKLGGMEGAQRFLRNELVVSTAIPAEYPIWKTVKLGLHKTPAAYRKALKSTNFKIGSWGDDILNKVSISETEQELDLVRRSVAELGFKDGAKYSDICAKAVELGLELCPNEVGPALRLQYKDQPRGEWFRVAMEPLTDSGGYLHVFRLEHGEDGVWLYGGYGHPDDFWSSDSVFVFGRPRK
jgi:hypothetical protein